MKAADVMTTASSIALLLLQKGISAVPVVDKNGAPLGMVSEGDLMPRDESERQARRDWWLKLLAEGEELSEDYIRQLEGSERPAREIMSAPMITVDAGGELVEVADILSAKRIKRVPVVRDGRMVGIVSRADLVKAVTRRTPEFQPSSDSANDLPVASDRLAALTRHAPAGSPAAQPAVSDDISVGGFRALVHHYEEEQEAQREETQHQTVDKHHEEARKLLASHLSDQAWHRMLHEARLAAQKGQEEHLLLRFPCELCSDHGRAVNAPDPSWPTTLRGLAAEVFMRWKEELRSCGFSLHARVVEFPDGLPGDIGLFLAWGR